MQSTAEREERTSSGRAHIERTTSTSCLRGLWLLLKQGRLWHGRAKDGRAEKDEGRKVPLETRTSPAAGTGLATETWLIIVNGHRKWPIVHCLTPLKWD